MASLTPFPAHALLSTDPNGTGLVMNESEEGNNQHEVKVQEKLGEYEVMVAPIERALRELQLAREMLRARTEDEINAASPALAALSDLLQVSSLDLLLAPDRHQFLQDALTRSGVSLEEVRQRVLEAESDSGEQMQALGLPETA